MTYTAAAEGLADTAELARTAGETAGRCARAGLDPSCYRGIIAAAIGLGGSPMRDGVAWDSDRELLDAVAGLQADVHTQLTRVNKESTRVRTALHTVENGRHTKKPSHRDTSQARTIADCEQALGILDTTAGRLRYTLTRISQVPDELGETYAAAYALITRGRQLPHDGRWLTGADRKVHQAGS